MSVVVVKFGGTSLASPELILGAARKVARIKKAHNVIVVVSAMGSTTDRLFQMSKKITPRPNARELDMLLTAGERISVALLSMALERLKLQAVSYTGSQVGIITDEQHTEARIIEIKGDRLSQALAENKIPVVCGFQGVSTKKEITTLGRGGSDTTALALSAAFKACKCIIYTDVDGIYTEDPNIFPGVKKIDRISYEEMLELSSRGAQVLHPRASRIAARFQIPVEVKSSFNNKKGTLITGSGEIEKPWPKAITHSSSLYLIGLLRVPKHPQYLSQMVTALAKGGVHLKFFFHGITEARKCNLSFITPLKEKKLAKGIIKRLAKKLGIKRIREFDDIGLVSVIGQGIGSDNELLARIFNTLSKGKIHIEAVTTSELSINIFLHKKFLKPAINSLLEKFRLRR